MSGTWDLGNGWKAVAAVEIVLGSALLSSSDDDEPLESHPQFVPSGKLYLACSGADRAFCRGYVAGAHDLWAHERVGESYPCVSRGTSI